MKKNDLVIYCNEQSVGDKPMYKKELEGNLGKIFKVKRKSGGDISVYNENFHNFYNTNLFKKIKISNEFIKKYLTLHITKLLLAVRFFIYFHFLQFQCLDFRFGNLQLIFLLFLLLLF